MFIENGKYMTSLVTRACTSSLSFCHCYFGVSKEGVDWGTSAARRLPDQVPRKQGPRHIPETTTLLELTIVGLLLLIFGLKLLLVVGLNERLSAAQQVLGGGQDVGDLVPGLGSKLLGSLLMQRDLYECR